MKNWGGGRGWGRSRWHNVGCWSDCLLGITENKSRLKLYHITLYYKRNHVNNEKLILLNILVNSYLFVWRSKLSVEGEVMITTSPHYIWHIQDNILSMQLNFLYPEYFLNLEWGVRSEWSRSCPSEIPRLSNFGEVPAATSLFSVQTWERGRERES